MSVDTSAEIAKAKTAIGKVESAVVDEYKLLINNPRFTSSRLWFAIGGLLAIVLLHHYGIDATILGYIFQVTIAFLVLRTLTDVCAAAFNTWAANVKDNNRTTIELARIAAGKDDGNPLAETTGTAEPVPATPK
jgi:xanthine/uracil/vitamin C permease (AzgA family)